MAVADQSDSPREVGWAGSFLRNQTVELESLLDLCVLSAVCGVQLGGRGTPPSLTNLPATRSIPVSHVVLCSAVASFRKGSTMFGANRTLDKELSKAVNKRLMRAGGGSQSRLTAAVQQGTVTLTGMLRYESERRPLLKAITGIPGVSRVIDQLQLLPKIKY